MNDSLLAWTMGTRCLSYLHAVAFMRQQGPRAHDPEAHAYAMRRMDHLAMTFATLAGHYGRRVLRQRALLENYRRAQ